MKDENLSREEIEKLLNSGLGSQEGDKHDNAQPRPEKDAWQEPTADPMVKPVVFEEFGEDVDRHRVPVAGMEILLDVPLTVSVELGKAKCYVKDLLNLTTGSVVELDRIAGDPVDILVNGKPFASGEVVVIDENFGVRIREIYSNDRAQGGIRKITG